MPRPRAQHHRRDDRGVAMVEFAFVGVLLVILLFGIINMGVLLSFKQNLTQSVSESARAAVGVASDGDASNGDERYAVVDAALADTLGDHDKSCGTPGEMSATPNGGITCLRMVHQCGTTKVDYSTLAPDPEGGCLTVRVEFLNRDPNRLMPAFPLIAMMEPDTMSAQTTVRLVPVS
jgi:Flp pilus assembly protein TadG